MSAAGGDELEDERVEWLGQLDGLAAELEPYLVLAGVDVVKGQAGYRGGSLGVEEQEQAGDSVLGSDGVVRGAGAGRGAIGLRCR